MSTGPQQQKVETTGRLIGDRFRLAVARDLARVYSNGPRGPLPPDLKRLIASLESRTEKPRA